MLFLKSIIHSQIIKFSVGSVLGESLNIWPVRYGMQTENTMLVHES